MERLRGRAAAHARQAPTAVNGNGREAAERRRHVGEVDVGPAAVSGVSAGWITETAIPLRSSWRNAHQRAAIACAGGGVTGESRKGLRPPTT